MMVIRPIARDDLPALMAIAAKAGVGMTTLPAHEGELTKRIEASLASFAGTADKRDEMFVFALIDARGGKTDGKLAGICAIAGAVGLRQPWYSYRVGQVVHASLELDVFTQTPTLFLSNDHTGNSELCSLFLDPEYRQGKNGQLLSKARFLFLAQHRERFSRRIIAELRGVSDAQGRSPFWEGLGRHFFAIDFARADYLTGIGKKAFVAELMPKHPLYTPFLPPDAQAVIGKTHEHTRPAQAMLESEGFRYAGHVDIFDAGPVVECDVDDIGAVKHSRVLRAQAESSAAAAGDTVTWLVGNTGFGDFRATLVEAPANAASPVFDAATASALEIAAGDEVRAVPLSPRDRHY
jgi:arginine N-succinyltransferase